MTSTAAPDVRRRLVEEAARILGEEGPAALSVRRLAAGAGTSTMAVYTHFGAMAAVVAEVSAEGFRRLIDHVGEVDETDDTVDDLRRMAVAYRVNALENRHLYGVMFGSTSIQGFPHEDSEVAHQAFEQIVAGIRRAMDAGALRPGPPDVVAAQFWSALHGFVMLELSGFAAVVDHPVEQVLWPMLGHLLDALSA